MPEYAVAANEQARKLESSANATAETAREYVQRATNYVLAVVLFAVALFFAGISTKLPRPGLKKTILAVGVIVFLVAAGLDRDVPDQPLDLTATPEGLHR